MGERGQILIKDTGVYLYTHWGGHGLKEMLQNVLSRNVRWNDEEYLSRIIFSEMIKDEIDGETGYGIGTMEHGDLNYPLLIIDVKKQTIKEQSKTWTFEKFITENFNTEDEGN